MTRTLAVFLCLLCAYGLVAAADVTATIAPQTAHVGDTLHLELQFNNTGGQSVRLPNFSSDSLAVLRVDSSQFAQHIMAYTVALYDTGRRTIANLPVIVGTGVAAETLRTPPVSVYIQSVVSDSAKSIRPLKPFREHPFQLRELLDWWWVAAILAALAAAWYVWRRFFSRKAREEAEAAIPLLPPHDEAIRNLITLKGKNYPQRGMLKEFFSEYSLVMRRYLERRYEFPALEMTTFDLAREMEDSQFPDVWTARLLPILREADLVKFAKHLPDFRECDAHIETGFELVSLTQAKPEPEAVEEKAA